MRGLLNFPVLLLFNNPRCFAVLLELMISSGFPCHGGGMSRLTPVLEYFIGSLVFCQRDVVLPRMFKSPILPATIVGGSGLLS